MILDLPTTLNICEAWGWTRHGHVSRRTLLIRHHTNGRLYRLPTSGPDLDFGRYLQEIELLTPFKTPV